MLATLIGDLDPVPEAPSLVSCDPPNHTRLRKLVNKAFTPSIIRSLGPRIREVAQDLVRQIAGQSEFDLVYDLSSPLPVVVIAEMLGVESEDRAAFKRWSDDILLATNRQYTAEDEQRIRGSITEFRAYFQETIAARRKDPREDLTTALVQAEEEEQKLKEWEVLKGNPTMRRRLRRPPVGWPRPDWGRKTPCAGGGQAEQNEQAARCEPCRVSEIFSQTVHIHLHTYSICPSSSPSQQFKSVGQRNIFIRKGGGVFVLVLHCIPVGLIVGICQEIGVRGRIRSVRRRSV